MSILKWLTVLAACEALVLPRFDFEFEKRELSGETDYVDVYGCEQKNVNASSLKDVEKTEYGCRSTAMLTLLINYGDYSLDALQNIIEHEKKDFTKRWQIYWQSIQQQCSADWGQWLVNDNGMSYLHCQKDPGDISQCGTSLSYAQGKAAKWHDLYIEDGSLPDAVSKYAGIFNFPHLDKSDFGIYPKDEFQLNMEVYGEGTIKAKNMTIPVVTSLKDFGNPYDAISVQQLQSLRQYVTVAKRSLYKVNPVTLLEYLKPVYVFQYAARAMTMMQTLGTDVQNIGPGDKDEGSQRFQNYLSTSILLLSAAYISRNPAQGDEVGDDVSDSLDKIAKYTADKTFTSPEFRADILGIFNAHNKDDSMQATLDVIMNNVEYDSPSSWETSMQRWPDYTNSLEALYDVEINNLFANNDTTNYFEQIW